MVFVCEAAHCWSHSGKRHNLQLYPWMADVSWVKWPKDRTTQNRWKRLIRRDGKDKSGRHVVVDKLNITRRSRLCSFHFDKEHINTWGIASSDPVYFAWNDWGRAANPRSLLAISINERNSGQVHAAYKVPVDGNRLRKMQHGQQSGREYVALVWLYLITTWGVLPIICISQTTLEYVVD